MVCIYCASPTRVTNSRHQKRPNQVWRRRQCVVCGNNFTTHELIELSGTIMVRHSARKLAPFSRDALYLSIHESCRHRGTATNDATALTQTIITSLRPRIQSGVIGRDEIVTATLATLTNFDKTAAAIYKAYHPLGSSFGS